MEHRERKVMCCNETKRMDAIPMDRFQVPFIFIYLKVSSFFFLSGVFTSPFRCVLFSLRFPRFFLRISIFISLSLCIFCVCAVCYSWFFSFTSYFLYSASRKIYVRNFFSFCHHFAAFWRRRIRMKDSTKVWNIFSLFRKGMGTESRVTILNVIALLVLALICFTSLFSFLYLPYTFLCYSAPCQMPGNPSQC